MQQFNAETTQFNIDNAAEATTDGVEVDAEWLVSENFRLRGAINYNKAEYEEFAASCYAGQAIEQGCTQVLNPSTGRFTAQDLEGTELAVAPEWVAMWGASYDLALPRSWLASFAVDGRYSDDYNVTTARIPEADQDSYTMWDATVTLTSPDQRWELSFIGRNLTDEEVAIQGGDRPLTGGGQGTAIADGLIQRADTYVRVRRGAQYWAEIRYKL